MSNSKDSSSQPSGASGSPPANPAHNGKPTSGVPSKYRIIKDGSDGSRTLFQQSFGLGMDPDGLKQGQAIFKAFQESDKQALGEKNGGPK